MKITVEHYTETISVEVPEEATSYDFADLMYRLSLMVGYNEKNVADAFAELGETYFTHNEPANAELRKDKERLDWLVGSGFLTHRIRQSGATPTREDIDIAMNSQEP